jgi:hypothetical protein
VTEPKIEVGTRVRITTEGVVRSFGPRHDTINLIRDDGMWVTVMADPAVKVTPINEEETHA